jgi:hypothetical protein
MRMKLFAIFADAPIVFFGVVIAVALTFRVAVGVARDAATPVETAPPFVTGAEPKKAEKPEPPKLEADPEAKPVAPSVEIGASARGETAKVQPLGIPAPARVPPRPRGHGRRGPRTDR